MPPSRGRIAVSSPPALSPAMSFDEACDAVVAYLKTAVPLGYWSVSRYDGSRQLYLSVQDDAYGKVAGDSHPWEDSLCRLMVTGVTPQIAPDAMAVPEYAAAGVAKALPIGAYVGIPIKRADGELFGTICGLDPQVQADALLQQRPLLELLSALLATVLEADLGRAAEARERARLQLDAETDVLTGLFNRRGWERFLVLEQEQHRRFGAPGSLIVLDLDGLKEINDSRGHAAGDGHIILAAETIRRSVRDTDVVARLGGDEFGILSVNPTPEAGGALVARLRASLATAGVECSIGAAPFSIGADFTAIWGSADQAMYAEKARRR